MRALRFLEAYVYAFLLHPIDLSRQLLSQRTRLSREFRRCGQGFDKQGVSRSVSELHVY